MDDLASYEAWKAKQQQNTVGAASVALGAAADANPDQVAGDLTLANEFGKVTGGPVPPVSLVQEHRPVFQSQIDRMRAETVLSSSPRLAEWLRNDPSNAPLAKDDLEGLSFWESLGVVPRGVASALPALNEGFYNVAGTLASIPGKNAVSDWLFSQADVSRGLKSTVAGPTGGWLGEQVQGAAQSIGLMTPGIVATYLSGGAAGPAVAAAYLAPGAVTQGGQSARAAIDAGKSPYQALLYGGQDAAAEVLFERIPVGKLIGDIAQGAGFGKILMGQLSREVPTEVATTLYQNLNQWVTLNPDKPLNDFLAEQPAAVRDTIAQTTLAVLGISGAGAAVSRLGRLADERARAQDAESRVALFQELSGQAVNSKLRARMPDRFRQFIEHATANGPVENVFVPAQEFATYWQGLGIDPHQVVGEMEGVTPDDLDAALAGGGDLRIPTATYAAKLAGTEHDAFMMQNMRFNPDDMTAKEAAEFNAKADEIMQEMWAEAEDRAAEDQRWKAADEKIYDEFVSRSRAAGMSTETATAAAVPVVAFYRSRAARTGMDVEDYLAQHALPRIEGAIPQGMQWKNVDGLNRLLAEARTTKLPKSAGRPAADTLIALGGIDPTGPAAAELKARDITPKTAPGLFKRGGMKSVDNIPIAEVGWMQHRGVDDGNGYVSEQAWIDALDAEHRGEPWQSENDAAAAQMNAAQLDDIENYLNRIGVTLDNTDEEIRAAIEADQNAPGRMYGQGPRGQITIAADGSSVIRLFETANLSTLHHELGHLFLSMMQNDAAGGDQGSLAELETVKGWWRENASGVAQDGNRAMPDAKLTAEDVQRAIDTGSTGDVIKDAAIDIGMQEQWARGYEAYLMEGKAPSVELRGVFAKFWAWMISVYKQLLNLQVNINDEIRGVFDRMLATDEEIAKAKRQTGIDDTVFATAEQMGLTADEFERFKKLRLAAEDDAMTRVMREAMAPIRREAEKAFQEEKARITAEVTKRINAAQSFRAFEWIVNGRWLGEDAPKDMPDMRLDRAALVDRYGEGVLATLSRDDVSAKGERARKAGWKRNAYAEGGMDPDEVAGWFGFDSGDALVSVLERIPDRKQAIKDEIAAEIFKLHGDPLNDGTIEQMALDAVHADKRAEVMAAELKAIADVAGADVQMTAKEAKASARQTIARMKVKDAQAAHRFLTAERKAGQEAARLGAMVAREAVWMHASRRKVATKAKAALRDAGTPDAVATQIDKVNASTANHNETVQKLIEAKRRQLINHALYMEARNAAEEVEKAENFIKRLNKATMRERIAGAGRREGAQIDYLAAIDEILDGYDFRKSAGIGRGEQRRGALLAYVEAMKAAGRENELAVPADVLARAQRTPYRLLTVEELRGVVDALKNLQHVALRWNDLIDAQNKRALDEAVAEVTAAIDANLPKRPPGRVRTTGEALRNTARQYLDLVLNATTLLREMDGFKDGGQVYSTMKAPIDAAMDRLALRKQKAAADLEALYAVYTKDERRKMAVRRMIPSLGYSLSKWELIAIALNTGNDGNMQRLTDPKVNGSLTEAQVKAVLGMLDERDANFVQSVWDYVGSFRDDIAARERRATGVEPAWVEASPVEIGGKKLRGGYYPLKYDPRLSARARDDEFQETLNGLQAGRFGKAQTRRGHLEARAKSSGRDVELDMSVLHRHINQVIYDLELSEPVANAWKVLQAGSVRSALSEAGRQADFDTLEAWLLDVGTGQLAAADLANRMARKMKSNFTAAKLAFNLATVASQVSGLSQTMVVVGKRDFLRGLMMWISHGGMVPSVTNGVAGVIGKRPFGSTIEDEIAAKSPFMAERMTTFNKDITDFYDDPALGPAAARWGEIKRDWIGPASFWLMTKTQWHIVDVPSWLGGYQQGLRMFGGDEAKAIAHADDIVKRAQASGLFSDRSAIERGSVSRTTRQSDVVRLFTTLGSYMFAKFNVAYERAAKGGRVISREGVSIASVQEVASMALDMVFLFTVEAVVMALIKGNLPGGDDDEEKGWGQFLAEETAFSVLGTMPFIRDVASFAQGFESGGAYGGLIAEIAKPFKEVAQGEIDKGLVKSIISGTGLATGLPAAQINRAVDAWWRQYLEGDDVAPVEYLLGKR